MAFPSGPAPPSGLGSSSGPAPPSGLARAPLLALAAACFAGIALPQHGVVATGLGVAGLALGALVLLAVAWFGSRRLGSTVATVSVLVAALAAGILARPPPRASALAGVRRALGAERLERPVLLEGVLLREAEDSGRSAALSIRLERLSASGEEWPVSGEASIRVGGARRDHLAGLARGARVRLWSRISEPRPPRNPGGRAGRGRLVLFGSTKTGLLVREIEPGSRFWNAVRATRARVRERLLASTLSRDAAGVVAAVLIGDRALVSAEVERSFRDAGTLHLMAVSGLHVGMLALLIRGAAVFLGVRRPRIALALLLAALPLYAALCGGRPSVVRAVLMVGVLSLGLRRGLSGNALNGLGLAALGLLAHSPGNAFDAGFQLSFGATLAILAVLRPGDPSESSWDREPRHRTLLLGPIRVTLAAQLATLPIVLWHFGRVVLGGVLLSAPAAVLAGPVLGLGIGWLFLGDLPLLGDATERALGAAAEALIAVSRLGAQVPFGAFVAATPGSWWFFAWFAGALFVLGWRGRRRLVPAGFLAALVLVALPLREPADGSLRLTALDVGMGDALVLGLPAGGAVLVDAGTAFDSFDAGERVVVPSLAELGYRRLRAVAVTHGDLDHVGGLAAVLREFPVDAVWEGRATVADDRPAVLRLRRERERRGIPLRELRAGQRFALGGARFRVLLAGDAGAERAARGNDRSLVLLVEFAGRRLLLTGDIGEFSERILLERHGRSLGAEVLKVGHHGSRFSTIPAFLAAVAPRVALVTARADRRRRLPDDGVLARLRSRGAAVFRTDHDGAITVRVAPDGGLSVETFRSGRSLRIP